MARAWPSRGERCAAAAPPRMTSTATAGISAAGSRRTPHRVAPSALRGMTLGRAADAQRGSYHVAFTLHTSGERERPVALHPRLDGKAIVALTVGLRRGG